MLRFGSCGVQCARAASAGASCPVKTNLALRLAGEGNAGAELSNTRLRNGHHSISNRAGWTGVVLGSATI